MSISIENQNVKADVSIHTDCIQIEFAEDPSYVRSDSVLLDMLQCSIGVVFQNSYHHIGDLPKNMVGKDVESLVQARLLGRGEGGRAIALHAPIKFVKKSVA